MRVPCNFCEFSISRCDSDQRLQEQDNEAVKEVERLRFLIKRMTGKDDDASFTELQSLTSHLIDARRIVLEQKKKIKLAEDESLPKQKKEAEDEDDGTSKRFLDPCKFSTSRSSSEVRQEKQIDGTVLLKLNMRFERRNAESFQCKFERLWLFNERMNGRELEGMTSLDLIDLDTQILCALLGLRDQMERPAREKLARPCDEESISRLAEHEIRYSFAEANLQKLCDFCRLSRDEQRLHKQDHDSVSMESELKRLRLLTRRMTGKDLDGLSVAEVLLLQNHLNQVLLIVKNQKDKIILEKDVLNLPKQKKRVGDEIECRKTGVLAAGKVSRSSSEERQEKMQSRMQLEYERRKAESMQSELERLWLLKERMNGRELVGMNSSELYFLMYQIQQGLRFLLDYLMGTGF